MSLNYNKLKLKKNQYLNNNNLHIVVNDDDVLMMTCEKSYCHAKRFRTRIHANASIRMNCHKLICRVLLVSKIYTKLRRK